MIQLGDVTDKFNLTYLQKTSEAKGSFELKNLTIGSAAPVARMWRR